MAKSRTIRLSGPGTYEMKVVGTSRHQDYLSKLCGGLTEEGHQLQVEAILVHENDNPYDANAVRIEIQRKPVGYLPRELAAMFRKQLAADGYPGARATVDAQIVGGWQRPGQEPGSFGIRLDIGFQSGSE